MNSIMQMPDTQSLRQGASVPCAALVAGGCGWLRGGGEKRLKYFGCGCSADKFSGNERRGAAVRDCPKGLKSLVKLRENKKTKLQRAANYFLFVFFIFVVLLLSNEIHFGASKNATRFFTLSLQGIRGAATLKEKTK